MARLCTVCIHSEVEQIDKALIEGESSQRSLAKRFKVSRAAVSRHFLHHLPGRIAGDHEAGDIPGASDNLTRLEMLYTQVQGILKEAREARTWHVCLEAIKGAARLIELSSKITGELRPEVSIVLNPEFVTIQTVIIKALEEFPQARMKVVEALKSVEGYAS